MSRFHTKAFGVVLSLAMGVLPCLADADAPTAADKLENQVKADDAALSEEQQQLQDYQEQADWYEQFAKKRLEHANIEKQEVEKRLKALEQALAKKPDKNPKSPANHELASLKAWLEDEVAKRRQIETTRERWRAAIASVKSKMAQTKYQKDADAASLEHQKDLDKQEAARRADDPKPKPPQIQQNTILMPGYETTEGNIPSLLGPSR